MERKVPIYYKIMSDGGFTVGDSDSGATAYAYPSSEHAKSANKDAWKTALAMLADVWRTPSIHDSMMAREFDVRMWKILHDTESDHTTRAIIDSIMERRMPARESSFATVPFSQRA